MPVAGREAERGLALRAAAHRLPLERLAGALVLLRLGEERDELVLPRRGQSSGAPHRLHDRDVVENFVDFGFAQVFELEREALSFRDASGHRSAPFVRSRTANRVRLERRVCALGGGRAVGVRVRRGCGARDVVSHRV
jgi:hypothetical protein